MTPEVAAATYESNVNTPGGFEKDAALDIEGFKNVLKLRAEIEDQWGGHPPAIEKYYDQSYYHDALAKPAAQSNVSQNNARRCRKSSQTDVPKFKPMVLQIHELRNAKKSARVWLASIVCAFCFALDTHAQQKERTIDEIKAEAVKRSENGMYPLIGLDPADVREAFTRIRSTDNDEWAAGFSAVADRYMSQAKALEASDPTKASALYVRAWRLYSFGRWPVPASEGKKRAYAKALEAFLAHAKLQENTPRSCPHPVRRLGNHWLSALAKECESPGAVSRWQSADWIAARKISPKILARSCPFGIGFIGVDSPAPGKPLSKPAKLRSACFLASSIIYKLSPEVDKTESQWTGKVSARIGPPNWQSLSMPG